MGTVCVLYSATWYVSKMKLFLGLAFAAVMANAGKLMDKYEKEVRDQSGITTKNQNKLEKYVEKVAEDAVNEYGKKAQDAAKSIGIKFNFKQVIRNLNKQFGKKAEKAVESSIKKTEGTVKKAQNGKNGKANEKR